MVMNSFMSEQLPLIKQNYTFPNEHSQCLTTNEATSQLTKSFLEQIEYLRWEEASKDSIISNLFSKDRAQQRTKAFLRI